jgi:hypothetical protein
MIDGDRGVKRRRCGAEEFLGDSLRVEDLALERGVSGAEAGLVMVGARSSGPEGEAAALASSGVFVSAANAIGRDGVLGGLGSRSNASGCRRRTWRGLSV